MKKKIVYVEDDIDLVKLVSLILTNRGCRIIGVSNPFTAFDTILKEKPDLVLLDLMMPDIDGWEIYHQLKGTSKTRKIPIIVISARVQPIDQVLGLQVAKVDDYICKPFQPEQLIATVEKWLAITPED